MLRFVKEYKRRKAFARAMAERKVADGHGPVLLNLGQIGSIGFLCQLEKGADPQQIAAIVEAFGQAGIPFRGLVVDASGARGTDASGANMTDASGAKITDAPGASGVAGGELLFVGKRNFNWLGIPVAGKDGAQMEEIGEFFSHHFDLFVNLNRNGSFILDFLALKADTKCLVGMHNNTKVPYSMVVEPGKGDFSYADYINGLLNYLRTINSRADEQ